VNRISHLAPSLLAAVVADPERMRSIEQTGDMRDTEVLEFVRAIRSLKHSVDHWELLQDLCDRFVYQYDRCVPSFFLLGTHN
jgi:hypothetical protein